MTTPEIITRIDKLAGALHGLTEHQLTLTERIVAQLQRPFLKKWRRPRSFLVNEQLLQDFGDVLSIHHCISKESLSKDRFEYALESTLRMCGKTVALADSRTNPGHDITIQGVRYSLKSQSDKSIKEDEILISKFMELGKGDWPDDDKGFGLLRDKYLLHMNAYDRIFTLRCLSKKPSCWRYELVEIPKALLQEAQSGVIEICSKTKQKTCPAYCRVKGADGQLRFELYFDAGSERKLHVKHIRKDLCIVHAQWEFATA